MKWKNLLETIKHMSPAELNADVVLVQGSSVVRLAVRNDSIVRLAVRNDSIDRGEVSLPSMDTRQPVMCFAEEPTIRSVVHR